MTKLKEAIDEQFDFWKDEKGIDASIYSFEVHENSETLIDMIKIFRNGKIEYEGIWSAFEMWFWDNYPKEFYAYCQLDYDDEYDNSFLIPEQLQKKNIDYILRNYINEFKDK